MQLVVYDLVAALFTPRQAEQTSTYSDRLFARICRMIEARFTDPDLTPSVVASEARISVRYLQKLFCARGTTCGHFIHSLLDHALRLQRRALSKSGQPLGELAFACGFLDYPHFSRRFRDRFGHSPSAHSTGALRKTGQMKFGLGADTRRVLKHCIAATMVDRCGGFVDLLTHEATFAGRPSARMMTAGVSENTSCASPFATASPAP
jgi:AraC-like DNA-binding protein